MLRQPSRSRAIEPAAAIALLAVFLLSARATGTCAAKDTPVPAKPPRHVHTTGDLMHQIDFDRNRVADALDADLRCRDPDERIVVLTCTARPVVAQHLDAFRRLGGEVRHVYREIAWGFSGSVPRERVPRLAKALGEDLVVIAGARELRPSLDFSTQQIRARDGDPADGDDEFAWTYGYEGDDRWSIAIVGTGITLTHDDLGDDPSDDAVGDADDWGDPTDPSHKVIGWFDSSPQRSCAPLDASGHETLVAGIVGGRGVADPAMRGVAGGARLVGLKFYWRDPSQGDALVGLDADLLKCLEWVLSDAGFEAAPKLLSDYPSSNARRLVPALGDVNGDGTVDLVLGVDAFRMFSVLINVGEAGGPPKWRSAPELALPRSDCIPVDILPNTRTTSPAVGDIDGDRVADVVVGQFVQNLNGSGGVGSIVGYKNSGSGPAPCGAQPPIQRWEARTDWSIGPADLQNDPRPAPALGDLVGDDDLTDLIVGLENGDLLGFKNVPPFQRDPPLPPRFEPAPALVAGITTNGQNAQPALADLDGDGDLDLLIGLRDGRVLGYRNDGAYGPGEANTPVWTEDSLLAAGAGVFGARFAAPALADLDGDADPDAVLGHETGLAAFRGITAINRDRHKIKVLNLSSGSCTPNPMIETAMQRLLDHGVVVVCSAGNDRCDDDPEADFFAGVEGNGATVNRQPCKPPHVRYPASYPTVLAVGATRADDGIAAYSNWGDPRNGGPDDSANIKPDVVAPGGGRELCGVGVITGPNDLNDASNNYQPDFYRSARGTSFAAPHVAAVAGLIIQAREDHGKSWGYTPGEVAEVKAVIQMTATETAVPREVCDCAATEGSPRINKGEKDRTEGYGRINADAAIEAETMSWDGSPVSGYLGSVDNDQRDDAFDKKCWARQLVLCGAADPHEIRLEVPHGEVQGDTDFDLYLFDSAPGGLGEPVLVASSTLDSPSGADESIRVIVPSTHAYYVVVKWVEGGGTFRLEATLAECNRNDLVVNSSFSSASSSDCLLDPWFFVEGHNPGTPAPEFSIETVDSAPCAMRIFRADSRDGSHAAAVQTIGAAVAENDTVSLEFDVRIERHNFARYDSWNVYPANARVVYRDEGGTAHTFRRSFYVDITPGHTPDAEPLAERIDSSVWVHREFDLSALEPRAAEIVEVRIGAQGWSYDIAFDNVSLIHAPGEPATLPFRRGDTNTDGSVDLSDPIRTLDVLFLGFGTFSCEDAADSNDDDAVDLSDAVWTLSYLFLGGPPPHEPGPELCGQDPTPGRLDCDEYAVCGAAAR